MERWGKIFLFIALLCFISSCQKASRGVSKKTMQKVATQKISKKLIYAEIKKEFQNELVDNRNLQNRLLEKGCSRKLVKKIRKFPLNSNLSLVIEDIIINNDKCLLNLIDDIESNPCFLRFLNHEPENLYAYTKMFNLHKSYRTNENRLRWIHNLQKQSTKKSNAKKLANQYAIKDLRIKEAGDQLFYYDGDQLLAKESNKIFDVSTFSDRPNNFLNQKLLPNSTYVVDDKFLYVIDQKGRVAYAEADLVLHKRGRDATLQAIGRDENGLQSGINALTDDGGHIFAQEFDGPTELINILPQLKIQNRGNDWRCMEKSIVADLKMGKRVHMKCCLIYEDNDMFTRPTKYNITKIVNGVEEKLVIPNTF